MALTDIYKTIHPKTREYTFFSAFYGTSKIHQVIRHKTKLNKYEKIEIIPCILSDHHRLRLIFNNSKNNRKQSLDVPSFHLSSKLYLCNSFHGCFVPTSKGQSVHTLFFVLLEFHVFCKWYLVSWVF